MSKRTEAATELFKSGYNCAQAVLGAFCEESGVKLETALKVAGGMGGGLHCGEVCGAVSGAVMALGLKWGQTAPGDAAQKMLCYQRTDEFMDAFIAQKGACTCRDLLGYSVRDTEAFKANVEQRRVICVGAITSAVELLEGLLAK